MACRKYTLTNNSPFTQTYTYQECNNLMWNYDFTIEAGQTRTIWLINGTYAAPLTSALSVSDDGVFPPANSPTPSVTSSITPTPTSSITPTPSVTPSVTPTNSVTPTVTPTITSSVTLTPSVTPTITPTQTSSNTPTPSITPTTTITSSVTPTPTVTPTNTETPTPTVTPTNTETPTPTVTPTNTPTPSSTPPIQGLFFTLQEVGPDVVLSGTGTADLASLTLDGPYSHGGTFIYPSQGFFNVGTSANNDYYSGATLGYNPGSFGSGSITSADLSTGDVFGLNGFGAVLVPEGYSGGLLNGTATFTATTLATLGVTVLGGHFIQWGASGASETITLIVS